MNMILMIAVGAWPQHSGKTITGAPFHPLAEIPFNVWIGQTQLPSIPEPDRTDVESIRPAMLTQFCTNNVVATTAMVGSIVVQAAQRRSERLDGGRHILAHPVHNRLRHFATKRRRRRKRDAAAILQYNSFKPNRVAHGTLAWAIERR